MSKRTRLFIGILFVFVAALGFFLWRVNREIDPRYRESAEEVLLDSAHVLAASIRVGADDRIDTTGLAQAMRAAAEARFYARIYKRTKTKVDVRVYVVDTSGLVLYDSWNNNTGSDFSQWRDVTRALRGEVGARTTEEEDIGPVMYVAVPIIRTNGNPSRNGVIVGAVAVGKPVAPLNEFAANARQQLFKVAGYSIAGFVLLLLVSLVWLTRPFGLIRDFWHIVRASPSTPPAQLLQRAQAVLRAAFDDMRDALSGRSYVEGYVQNLTHEIKSPLAAIRGAAELLQEPNMPPEQRTRFISNIQDQTSHLQDMVQRLLELTSLEKRRVLEVNQAIDLHQVIEQTALAMMPLAQQRQVELSWQCPEKTMTHGDPFLLARAVTNLLQNALEFSSAGMQVQCNVTLHKRQCVLTITDQGPGIPDYAADKLFDKFYSLPRPTSGKKSTGLGLAFVREIALLHHGSITVENRKDTAGAQAVLSLPRHH